MQGWGSISPSPLPSHCFIYYKLKAGDDMGKGDSNAISTTPNNAAEEDGLQSDIPTGGAMGALAYVLCMPY